MAKIKRCLGVLLMAAMVAMCLSGCAFQKRLKSFIFDALKNEGAIQVGEQTFNDYTSTNMNSKLTVTGKEECFHYECDDTEYVILFDSRRDEEHGKAYHAKVLTIRNNMEKISDYYLKRRFLGKVEVIDKKEDYYSYSFDGNNPYALTDIKVDGSTIDITFSKEKAFQNVSPIADYYETYKLDASMMPDIFRDEGGNMIKPSKVNFYDTEQSYRLNLKYDNANDFKAIYIGNISIDSAYIAK